MDPKKVKRIAKHHKKTIHITIRVSPHTKRWLIQNRYSPAAIFHEAIKELGYKKK